MLFLHCILIFVVFVFFFCFGQVYANKIIRYLEEPSDSLSLIRDDDKLVAYRLQKDLDDSTLIVFMHQNLEE